MADATNWNEEQYRTGILEERAVDARTVFRSVFAPTSKPAPDIVVAASSDGTVVPYSITACISAYSCSEPPQLTFVACGIHAIEQGDVYVMGHWSSIFQQINCSSRDCC
eukprot:Gb_40592 [translate_table: standard]